MRGNKVSKNSKKGNNTLLQDISKVYLKDVFQNYEQMMKSIVNVICSRQAISEYQKSHTKELINLSEVKQCYGCNIEFLSHILNFLSQNSQAKLFSSDLFSQEKDILLFNLINFSQNSVFSVEIANTIRKVIIQIVFSLEDKKCISYLEEIGNRILQLIENENEISYHNIAFIANYIQLLVEFTKHSKINVFLCLVKNPIEKITEFSIFDIWENSVRFSLKIFFRILQIVDNKLICAEYLLLPLLELFYSEIIKPDSNEKIIFEEKSLENSSDLNLQLIQLRKILFFQILQLNNPDEIKLKQTIFKCFEKKNIENNNLNINYGEKSNWICKCLSIFSVSKINDLCCLLVTDIFNESKNINSLIFFFNLFVINLKFYLFCIFLKRFRIWIECFI